MITGVAGVAGVGGSPDALLTGVFNKVCCRRI